MVLRNKCVHVSYLLEEKKVKDTEIFRYYRATCIYDLIRYMILLDFLIKL